MAFVCSTSILTCLSGGDTCAEFIIIHQTDTSTWERRTRMEFLNKNSLRGPGPETLKLLRDFLTEPMYTNKAQTKKASLDFVIINMTCHNIQSSETIQNCAEFFHLLSIGETNECDWLFFLLFFSTNDCNVNYWTENTVICV